MTGRFKIDEEARLEFKIKIYLKTSYIASEVKSCVTNYNLSNQINKKQIKSAIPLKTLF